jgi:sugar/nucleoside kinase (ribokinase family)
MRALGVDVRIEPVPGGAPTARSHILITPDGQRTMQTYLGACTELSVSDISARTIGEPEIVLLEGYVWDIAEGPALIDAAVAIAKKHSARIALSLSDSFCVERHREEFLDAIRSNVDIVFADDDEVTALLQVDTFDDVARAVPEFGRLFVMTRSEKGSVIMDGSARIDQPAIPVAKVVDTTGAGDAYTAGFLFGLAGGRTLEECARLGTQCGSAVIQRVGARIPAEAISDAK